jgi:hypothetical protein
MGDLTHMPCDVLWLTSAQWTSLELAVDDLSYECGVPEMLE